jgi:hypothetical protein
MMVMPVVLSGKGRYRCAQQQNTGQYCDHRFLQRFSSTQRPIGAPTLFLALRPDSFHGLRYFSLRKILLVWFFLTCGQILRPRLSVRNVRANHLH